MANIENENIESIDDGTAYFVRIRGRIQGPFTVTQLKKLRQRGQFSRAHEVSIDQLNWQSASTLEAVFAVPKKAAPLHFEKVKQTAHAPNVANQPPATAAQQNHDVAEWHYTIGEEPHGPVRFVELHQLIANGRVTEYDLVWKNGMADWTPVCEMTEFRPQTTEYLRPTIAVPNRGETSRSIKYAGFWFRFFALLIDSVVLGAASAVLTFTFAVVISVAFQVAILDVRDYAADSPEMAALGMAFIVSWMGVIVGNVVLQWLYFALMESSSHRATLGKLACGIIVTDVSGKPATFAQATGRFFAKIISNITLGIGWLMCIWTARQQCLHDKMAGCIVVKK